MEILEFLEDAKNYNRALVELVLRAYPLELGRVMDFGAGTGTFSSLVRVARPGWDLSCLEPDAELSNRLLGRGFAVARELAHVPAGSLDYAFSLNVFEHIEDDVGVARELISKLRPGGKLFVFVPAGPELYSRFDAHVNHFRRYTKESLAKLAPEDLVNRDDLRFWDPLGWAAAMVYKVVSPWTGLPQGKNIAFFDENIFPLNEKLQKWTEGRFGKNLCLTATAK